MGSTFRHQVGIQKRSNGIHQLDARNVSRVAYANSFVGWIGLGNQNEFQMPEQPTAKICQKRAKFSIDLPSKK